MPWSWMGSFLLHGFEVVFVGVPAAVVDGDEGDSGFHQAAGEQAGLAELIAAVAIAHGVLLLREVEGLARVAEDQAVGLLLELVHFPVDFLLVGLRGQGVDRFQQARGAR